MARWKHDALKEVIEEVELKNEIGKDLSVEQFHLLKKLFIETVSTVLGLFNEAVERKKEYTRWLDNPLLIGLYKNLLKDFMQVKGVRVDLRPFHTGPADPQLIMS